ncbi:MAG: hypothetical protein C0504_09425 [Candidatus Solibacter sp.]|nr:hypothetical protein [Candidatus Solibacter sp.]
MIAARGTAITGAEAVVTAFAGLGPVAAIGTVRHLIIPGFRTRGALAARLAFALLAWWTGFAGGPALVLARSGFSGRRSGFSGRFGGGLGGRGRFGSGFGGRGRLGPGGGFRDLRYGGWFRHGFSLDGGSCLGGDLFVFEFAHLGTSGWAIPASNRRGSGVHRQPRPFQGDAAGGLQPQLRLVALDELGHEPVAGFQVVAAVFRPFQHPIQSAMQPPRTRLALATGLRCLWRQHAIAFPVKTRQFAQIRRRAAELLDQTNHGVPGFGSLGHLLPIESAAEKSDAIVASGFGDLQLASGLGIHDCGRRAGGRQGKAHGEGLALDSGHILKKLFGGLLEQPLHLAGEGDQGIPGSGDGELVAARIEDSHLLPELGLRAEHLDLAGEEVAEKQRAFERLVDGPRPAQPGGELIDIGAENAPELAASCAGRQHGRTGLRVARFLVAGRGVAGERKFGIGRGEQERLAEVEARRDGGRNAAIETGEGIAGAVRLRGERFKQALGFDGVEAAPAVQLLGEALTDIRPVAQIFSGGPGQTEGSIGNPGQGAGGFREVVMGLRDAFGGEHHQELAAAGGADQLVGELQMVEQGARDGVGKDAGIEAAAGQRVQFTRGRGGERFDAQQLGL